MCKNPKYRLDSLRSTQLTFINVMNVHYINYDMQDTCTCRRLPWRRSLFILTYSFLCRCKLNRFVVSCLGPFAFLLPTIFELFGFPIVWLCAYLMKVIPETYLMKVIPETCPVSVADEGYSWNVSCGRTWWRLFLKHVVSVPNEDYSWNVPDEGYSWNASCERTWWRLFLKHVVSVPDEGYSWDVSCERTWWGLFLKRVVRVPDEGYSWNVPDEGYSWNMLWAYLMKVIPETYLMEVIPETCPVQ